MGVVGVAVVLYSCLAVIYCAWIFPFRQALLCKLQALLESAHDMRPSCRQ